MNQMEVLGALQDVLDPEVGIDIVSLGLVEEIVIDPGRGVEVRLIMTSVACPMHADLARQAEEAVRARSTPGVDVRVSVLDRPEWTPDRMSPDARRRLGW